MIPVLWLISLISVSLNPYNSCVALTRSPIPCILRFLLLHKDTYHPPFLLQHLPFLLSVLLIANYSAFQASNRSAERQTEMRGWVGKEGNSGTWASGEGREDLSMQELQELLKTGYRLGTVTSTVCLGFFSTFVVCFFFISLLFFGMCETW